MRLLIDLEKLRKLKPEGIGCSYTDHPGNRGVTSLIEKATFYLICRHCELGTCVEACPRDALEKEADDIVRRYPLRCSNCYSCASACPFGTIVPEFIPYHTPTCDYCLGRRGEGEAPLCARSAPEGAVQYGDFEEDVGEGIFRVDDNLLVRAVKWVKEKT